MTRFEYKRARMPKVVRREAVAKRSRPKPQYRNVYYRRDTGTYSAKVELNGRCYALGCWITERDAAIARDRALLYFGITDRPFNLSLASRRAGPASIVRLPHDADLRPVRSEP